MAYGNNNNSRYGGGNNSGTYNRKPERASDDVVSSSGVTFTNEDAGKILNMNYWGRNLSLEIASCPAGSPITWEVRRNAQALRQVISFQSIGDFVSVCEEVYDAIKANGSFTTVGVRVGSKQDAMIEISNGENLGMHRGVYLVIYKGLDNTNRTNTLEIYPFSGTRVVRDYDHTTGNYKEDISKLGEFKKFLKVLHSAEDAFTMAHAHASSELKKGDKMAIFQTLAAVSASLGVDVAKDLLNPPKKQSTGGYMRNQNPSGGYQRGGYQQRGSYNAPRSGSYTSPRPKYDSPAPSYQAAMAQLGDEPVDLSLDVAQLQGVDLTNFPS